MRLRTIARPNPVPLCLVVKNGSQMRCLSSEGIPAPAVLHDNQKIVVIVSRRDRNFSARGCGLQGIQDADSKARRAPRHGRSDELFIAFNSGIEA